MQYHTGQEGRKHYRGRTWPALMLFDLLLTTLTQKPAGTKGRKSSSIDSLVTSQPAAAHSNRTEVNRATLRGTAWWQMPFLSKPWWRNRGVCRFTEIGGVSRDRTWKVLLNRLFRAFSLHSKKLFIGHEGVCLPHMENTRYIVYVSWLSLQK